jgi:AhpD family alkylhydroperoxidase
MARIPLETNRRGLLVKLLAWYSRRAYGKVLDPLAAMAQHRGVLLTMTAMELGVQRWRRLSPTLHCLAVQASSAAIGCSWCLDFGFWEAHHKGVDPAKIHDVSRWRQSGVYTELERLVLEYAEAMTATPPAVTDELVGLLRDQLGDAALVELTELVAVENLRSRFNAALGLESQGFKALCEVRPPVPA